VCVEKHRPDLAVLDIRMPPFGNAGLLAAEKIRDRYGGSTAVLVLSQYLEPDYALRLLGPGVGGVGYLLKESVAVADELVDAARRVAAGGSAIDPAVVEELVRAQRCEDRRTKHALGDGGPVRTAVGACITGQPRRHWLGERSSR